MPESAERDPNAALPASASAAGTTGTAAGPPKVARFLVLLAVLSVGVYANALGNGFALDDNPVVVENENVHDLSLLPRLFTEPHWDNYRPVTLTTFALEWAVSDGAPALFHATNVGLHALVTCLLFLLLVRLGAPHIGAAVGAAIFAVHPVHVEAVSNVVGRAELLVAVFTLLALLVHTSARSRAFRAVGVAVLVALALGSKENGVAVPALMLLTTAFLAPTVAAAWASIRRDLPVYAGVVAVGGAYALVRRSVVGTFTLYQQAYGFDLDASERVLTAIGIWPEYVRLLFFPADLSAEYGPGLLMPMRSVTWEVLLGAIVGIGCLLLVPLLWRRSRWVSLGVAWFALSIFPVSNLVIPVGIWLAERNLYLPSVSVAMLAAALVAALRDAPGRAGDGGAARGVHPLGMATAIGIVLVLGSWRTWTRTPTWESTDSVLFGLMEEQPESFRAQWHMANLLSSSNQPERALEYIERARDLVPGHGQVILDHARLLGLNGRPEDAEAVLRENEWLAASSGWRTYMTFALLDQGRADEALEVAEEGARLSPESDLVRGALEAARAAAASDTAPRAPSDTVPP